MFRTLVRSAFVCMFFVAGVAQAEERRFGPHDIPTAFSIGKNLDKNEVHFGVHVDENCQPRGDAPVFAYWRQFEQGPDVTEDLNLLDQTGYGISEQWVERRGAASRIIVALRATKERKIAISVKRGSDGTCVALPVTQIQGNPARLDHIYVFVSGFLRVGYIELRGGLLPGGSPVVERVKP